MKMKKRYIIISLLMLMIVPIVSGTETTITTLDYLSTDVDVVLGDINLSFSHSTRSNHDDLTVNKITYDPTYNFTLFFIQSNAITIGFDFINDTKAYYYNDNNSNDTYVVYVDYSSISSPWGYYILLLEEKNTTIVLLESQLENLTQNQSVNQSVIANLRAEIESNKTNYDSMESSKNNMTTKVGKLENDTIILEKLIGEHEDTIRDLTNPFALTYDRGPVKGVVLINVSWAIIGGVASLIAYFIFVRKKNPLDVGREILGKTGILKNKETEVIPEIESEILNQKVDKVLKADKVPKKNPGKQNLSKAMKNYWDSPAGLARKKEMGKE